MALMRMRHYIIKLYHYGYEATSTLLISRSVILRSFVLLQRSRIHLPIALHYNDETIQAYSRNRCNIVYRQSQENEVCANQTNDLSI